jgi:hypothetical protein
MQRFAVDLEPVERHKMVVARVDEDSQTLGLPPPSAHLCSLKGVVCPIHISKTRSTNIKKQVNYKKKNKQTKNKKTTDELT